MGNLTPEYAHCLKNLIIDYTHSINQHLWSLAKALKAMRDKKIYKLLGYDSFDEFATQPDIGIKRSTIYALIRRYEVYIHKFKMLEADLLDVDHTKLDAILPVVENCPEEWIEKARHLSHQDLINEVRLQQGRPEMLPAPKKEEASGPFGSYEEYVRSKPCCICGSSPSQYAHFPRTKATGGNFGIPLCPACHASFHNESIKDWAYNNRSKWGSYLEKLVEDLFKK